MAPLLDYCLGSFLVLRGPRAQSLDASWCHGGRTLTLWSLGLQSCWGISTMVALHRNFPWCRWAMWADFHCRFDLFLTCQVRVSRFYQLLSSSPSPPLSSSGNCEFRISVGTAGPQLRVPADLSGHCWTSTASASRPQWALPDLNCECQQISVGTAGPQLRVPADLSGHCRTSTASASRSQWALPDLNCECQISVGTTGRLFIPPLCINVHYINPYCWFNGINRIKLDIMPMNPRFLFHSPMASHGYNQRFNEWLNQWLIPIVDGEPIVNQWLKPQPVRLRVHLRRRSGFLRSWRSFTSRSWSLSMGPVCRAPRNGRIQLTMNPWIQMKYRTRPQKLAA